MNEQELIWSAVAAWVSSKAIEMSKYVSWLPTGFNRETANRWVARFIAFCAMLGIHSTFDHANGTLIISGLTMPGIFTAAGEYAKQYMLQEIAYKKFIKGDVQK